MDVPLKTFEQKEAYRRWRRRQMGLPLAELVKEPNCGLHCIGTAYEFSCGCSSCSKSYWQDGEIDRRLTATDIQFLKDSWNKKTGWLRGDGCVLPRRIRPEECLRVICDRIEALRNG